MLCCFHLSRVKVCVSVLFHRLHEGGISCPEVVLLRKHVLIMSFIGQDQRPAPKLKEATLTQEEMTTAYHQTIQVSGGTVTA